MVTCLFTGKGRVRLAPARVRFRGTDQYHDNVIAYSPGRSNHHVRLSGQLRHQSIASADLTGELDLRNPRNAAKFEKLVRAQQVEDLVAGK
jgi:hypothetical protein